MIALKASVDEETVTHSLLGMKESKKLTHEEKGRINKIRSNIKNQREMNQTNNTHYSTNRMIAMDAFFANESPFP